MPDGSPCRRSRTFEPHHEGSGLQYCGIEGDQVGAHSEERCAMAMLSGIERANYEDIRRIAGSVGERASNLLLPSISRSQPVLVDYRSGDGQDPSAALQVFIYSRSSTEFLKGALYKILCRLA